MNNRSYSTNDAPVFLKIIVYGFLTVLLVVLQTTLMPRLCLFGVFPDIVIVAVCCVGIYSGENTAALFGFISGLAVTALGSVGVSFEPLFYVFVGYFCGRVGVNARNNRRFWAYLISMPAVCLVRAFISFVNFHIEYFGSIEYGRLFLDNLLPEFCYTLIIAVPVFVLVWLFELPIANRQNRGDMY